MKKASQYKNEFAFFKLISRLCPDTLKMANIGEFPWTNTQGLTITAKLRYSLCITSGWTFKWLG